MVMKDISAVDSLERGVREDPTAVAEVIDRIDDRLAGVGDGVDGSDGSRNGAGDRDAEVAGDRDGGEAVAGRLDAARALRAAAEHDGALVAPYLDRYAALLSADHGSLRLSGAVGVAAVADHDPARVRPLVPALVDLLRSTAAPATETAVLRALTLVGMESPATVADADPVVAERIPGAALPTRMAVVGSFVGAVREEPSSFPETVSAYVRVLEGDTDRMARHAAESLAEVAAADPAALPSPATIVDRVEELAAGYDDDPMPDAGAGVEDAARTLRETALTD